KMIGDEPQEKGRRHKSQCSQEEQLFTGPHIQEKEQEEQNKTERHESVDVEKRHGRVKTELNPKGKEPPAGRGYLQTAGRRNGRRLGQGLCLIGLQTTRRRNGRRLG